MTLTIYDILMLIGIPSMVAFIFQLSYTSLSGKFKKDREEQIMIKKALQALLRDRLRDHYLKYIDQGWVDIDDKANFDNMYRIYHSLGDNGVMDDMYKKVMVLPTCLPKS